MESPVVDCVLLALMKKHSKTGAESRFQGTLLGHPADVKPVRIEGGPSESITEWNQKTQQRAVKLDGINGDKTTSTEPMQMDGDTPEE